MCKIYVYDLFIDDLCLLMSIIVILSVENQVTRRDPVVSMLSNVGFCGNNISGKLV